MFEVFQFNNDVIQREWPRHRTRDFVLSWNSSNNFHIIENILCVYYNFVVSFSFDRFFQDVIWYDQNNHPFFSTRNLPSISFRPEKKKEQQKKAEIDSTHKFLIKQIIFVLSYLSLCVYLVRNSYMIITLTIDMCLPYPSFFYNVRI